MIHLLFISQSEGHTFLVFGLAVGVNIWVTGRESSGKILRKLKAFLGDGFKTRSLDGTNLGAPLAIPQLQILH